MQKEKLQIYQKNIGKCACNHKVESLPKIIQKYTCTPMFIAALFITIQFGAKVTVVFALLIFAV